MCLIRTCRSRIEQSVASSEHIGNRERESGFGTRDSGRTVKKRSLRSASGAGGGVRNQRELGEG